MTASIRLRRTDAPDVAGGTSASGPWADAAASPGRGRACARPGRGCGHGQGFLFSRGVHAAEVPAVVERLGGSTGLAGSGARAEVA